MRLVTISGALAAVAGVLLGTACADVTAAERRAASAPRGDAELGQCERKVSQVREPMPPLQQLLVDRAGWVEIRSVAPRPGGDEAGLSGARMDVTSLSTGTSSTRDALVQPVPDRHLARELAAGNRVVASMQEITPGGAWLLGPTWVVRPDGTAAAVGGCAVETTTAFNDFVAGLGDGRTPAWVLLSVLGGSADDVAAVQRAVRRRAPARTWWDRDASVRNSHDAPADAKAGWTSDFVYFRIPESWRGFDVTICTRFEDAWNQCASPAAKPLGLDTGLTAYRRPGAGVEVWVLDGRATLQRPLGRVHVVPRAAFADGEPVILAGDPSIGSVEQLLARAKTGPSPFAAVAGPVRD